MFFSAYVWSVECIVENQSVFVLVATNGWIMTKLTVSNFNCDNPKDDRKLDNDSNER